jgi:hypothetical protein
MPFSSTALRALAHIKKNFLGKPNMYGKDASLNDNDETRHARFPDGTPSHSTRLPKNDNQVAGYHPCPNGTTDRTTDETSSHSAMPPKNGGQAAGYSHLTDKTTSHSTRLSKGFALPSD